jgi:hypothetical protein
MLRYIVFDLVYLLVRCQLSNAKHSASESNDDNHVDRENYICERYEKKNDLRQVQYNKYYIFYDDLYIKN